MTSRLDYESLKAKMDDIVGVCVSVTVAPTDSLAVAVLSGKLGAAVEPLTSSGVGTPCESRCHRVGEYALIELDRASFQVASVNGSGALRVRMGSTIVVIEPDTTNGGMVF